MLGIGFGEIVIIAIVLIMAVGPDKLPTLMKTVGKTIRQVRETSRDLRNSIGLDELMREDYLRDRPKPLRSLSAPADQVPRSNGESGKSDSAASTTAVDTSAKGTSPTGASATHTSATHVTVEAETSPAPIPSLRPGNAGSSAPVPGAGSSAPKADGADAAPKPMPAPSSAGSPAKKVPPPLGDASRPPALGTTKVSPPSGARPASPPAVEKAPPPRPNAGSDTDKGSAD